MTVLCGRSLGTLSMEPRHCAACYPIQAHPSPSTQRPYSSNFNSCVSRSRPVRFVSGP
jgi:hypothetical protein